MSPNLDKQQQEEAERRWPRGGYCSTCDLFVADWDEHEQDETHKALEASRAR